MAKQRYAVTAVNHETGESWSIHDTLETCEKELNAKLADWTTVNGKKTGHSIPVTVTGPDPVEG